MVRVFSPEAELANREGLALMELQPAEALHRFSEAMELGYQKPDLFCNMSAILLAAQKYEEAWKVCEVGLQHAKGDAVLLGNQGVALARLGYYKEALGCFELEAKQRKYEYRPWKNQGNMYRSMGRTREAIDHLQVAVNIDPGNADHRFNLSLALLLAGEYRAGFEEFEFRPRLERSKYPNHAFWDGSVQVNKRVLIWNDQGLGDAIQCARYLPWVQERLGSVVIEVPKQLQRLFSWIPGNFHIVVDGQEAVPFDVQSAFFSLPHLHGTEVATIPPPQRFEVPEVIKEQWAQRVVPFTGIKVALVWAGSPTHTNNQNRSLSLSDLRPLLSVPDITLFSVQMGPPSKEIEELGLSGRIVDLAPHITDFGDTAAILSQMDLLITVDTSVAHLAGSLGVAVWMLTPYAPDWRWMLKRDDSPWYPTIRLFRQPRPRTWEKVIQRIVTELPTAPQRARSDGRSIAAEQTPLRTDVIRWADTANLSPSWDARAKIAADFLPRGANVLDLGCGAMALERFLPSGCTYIPCDLVARDSRTLICNFNEQSLPPAQCATHISLLGVLEYIHDWRCFLRQLRARSLPVIMSYCPVDFTSHLDRSSLGWVNHLTLAQLCDGLSEAGLSIQSSTRVDGNQVFLKLTPDSRHLIANRRVLVLSYNNVGNFGDRLGIHLVQNLIPAGAEVTFCNFYPWNVPDENFDLLVLGIGNSVFEPILTEELLALVRRVPKSVGIFGTQYREAINKARLSRLLDSLTVWFARHEEDVLLYGKGRSNVVYLGDWLISAFPLTRWKRDEMLHVGPEIWNDLPLDRTIQNIQQFRSVASERIHPLLCALSSAEKVSFIEQRSGGLESGKFRGMLLDIFGRSYNESTWFDVNRDAVADYRARVMRTMAAMPELFHQLLQ